MSKIFKNCLSWILICCIFGSIMVNVNHYNYCQHNVIRTKTYFVYWHWLIQFMYLQQRHCCTSRCTMFRPPRNSRGMNFQGPKTFFQINLILQVAFFKDIESPKKETGHPQRGRAKVNSCSPNRATSILLKRTTETEKKQQGRRTRLYLLLLCRCMSWTSHLPQTAHNTWRITWQLPAARPLSQR